MKMVKHGTEEIFADNVNNEEYTIGKYFSWHKLIQLLIQKLRRESFVKNDNFMGKLQ